MNDKITPLPWKIGDEDDGLDGVEYVQIHAGEYGDNSFRGIANVEAGFDGEQHKPLDGETRANAAYIVKACNEYPRLISALERCAKIVEVNNHRQNEKVDDAAKIARDAIASAEKPNE